MYKTSRNKAALLIQSSLSTCLLELWKSISASALISIPKKKKKKSCSLCAYVELGKSRNVRGAERGPLSPADSPRLLLSQASETAIVL